MDMTGEELIAAPRKRVYEALNDVDILKRSIPGCEEIEKTSDTEMTAKVVIKVGPVKAKFSGNVTLSDLNPPEGYTISGQGAGSGLTLVPPGARSEPQEAGAAPRDSPRAARKCAWRKAAPTPSCTTKSMRK